MTPRVGRAAQSRSRLAVVLLFLLPVAVLSASVVIQRAADSADASPDLTSGSPEQRVERYLAAERQALGIPGMALAVVRTGQPDQLWADGAARPGVPLTPQTPIQLASVSKSLTAVAVMQLVQSGRLALKAPVVSYLPWFTTADRAASRTITVAELLHHSSGLADGVDTDGALLDDQSPAALERGVRLLAKVQLAFPPGQGYHYANLNYNVLGELVQTQSKMPFADYMHDHVFVPMGMQHATSDPAAADAAGAAAGYYRWFGRVYRPAHVPIPSRSAPSATSYASAADLARELRMNLGSGTVDHAGILSAASVAELHRPGSLVDPFTAYAMGWQVRPLWEKAQPIHYSGLSADLPMVWEHTGSWPTTATYLGFSPSLRLGFVLLMNGNDRAAESRQYVLASNVWRVLLDNPPQPLGAPTEDFLTHYGWAVALTLLATQLSVLVAAAYQVRHRRSLSGRRRLAWLVLPALFDLSLLGFIWLYLPRTFETPVLAIIRNDPDIGVVIVVGTAVALLWGLTRTVLLTLRSGR